MEYSQYLVDGWGYVCKITLSFLGALLGVSFIRLLLVIWFGLKQFILMDITWFFFYFLGSAGAALYVFSYLKKNTRKIKKTI